MHYIFGGRFQPFHAGHLEIIRHVVQYLGHPLVIGIINPSPGSVFPGEDEDFVRFSKPRNPFSYWERYQFIHRSVSAAGLSEGIAAIVPLPRPSINLAAAENYLPEKKTWILCERWHDELEPWKRDKYRSQGQAVEMINIENIDPIAQLITAELIRHLLRVESNIWEGLVPPPVREFLSKKIVQDRIIKSVPRSDSIQYLRQFLNDPRVSKCLGGVIGQSLKPENDIPELEDALKGILGKLVQAGLTIKDSTIYFNNHTGDAYSADQVGAMGSGASTSKSNFLQPHLTSKMQASTTPIHPSSQIDADL